MSGIMSVELPGIRKVCSGKVREIFDVGDAFLIVATDHGPWLATHSRYARREGTRRQIHGVDLQELQNRFSCRVGQRTDGPRRGTRHSGQ